MIAAFSERTEVEANDFWKNLDDLDLEKKLWRIFGEWNLEIWEGF